MALYFDSLHKLQGLVRPRATANMLVKQILPFALKARKKRQLSPIWCNHCHGANVRLSCVFLFRAKLITEVAPS